jgi:hypothetical protein
VQKTTEDALRRELEAQHTAIVAQARMPAMINPQIFWSKARIPVVTRYSLEGWFCLLLTILLILSLRSVLACRLVTRPQGGLVTPSSPSRTRSPKTQVVGEALTDDARTPTPPRGAVESGATVPPAAGLRVETPPCVADAGGASAGGIGATTSPAVIDINPISDVPGGADVRD